MTAVVSDASVALKWFHTDGEEEVDASRAIVGLFGRRLISLSVLDLTKYEVGNALMRGRASASPAQVAEVLDALADVCPEVAPSASDMRVAAHLAGEHGLTMYDATYAAVARGQGAELATMDRELLRVGLGQRPSEIVARVEAGPRMRPIHKQR